MYKVQAMVDVAVRDSRGDVFDLKCWETTTAYGGHEKAVLSPSNCNNASMMKRLLVASPRELNHPLRR